MRTVGLSIALLAAAGAAGVAAAADTAAATDAAAAVRVSSVSLANAAEAGETSLAMDMLNRGADVNAAQSDGTTALMWAVHRDDRPLVERLLKAHANVKVINEYGASALSEAARFGDAAVVKELLEAGADPDSPNADGETALMLVARAGNVPAAESLIRHGANVNAKENVRGQTALHWAAAESQAEMVKLLLRHHADPNARSLLNLDRRQVSSEPRIQWRPPGGLTPLLYAARQGCLQCVEYLLKGGADPNLPDPDGISPLLIATENFHFDVAAYLLEKGGNPNQWDWWGRTPLYAAVDLDTLPTGGRADHISLDKTTSLEMIRLLLDAGANPNAQLKLFPPFRQIGADRGADLMLTIGTTPLIRAAKAGDSAAIRLLLAHGANPSLPNSLGITPLMAAAGLGSDDIDTRGAYVTQQQAIASIDLFLAAGADINLVDNRGQSALHGAAYRGWDDVIKYLVAHRAELYVKDKRGFSPVDTALGRSDGHGRNHAQFVDHAQTAALLQQLMASHPRTARSAPPVESASQLL
jgi:uncharacterized protein